MAPDRRQIDRLAERQHFVVTRSQVLELGASATWLRHQVVTRRWRRLYPGVYVNHHAGLDWRTRAFGALSYAGPGAALCHASAGAWWFDTPAARQQAGEETLVVRYPFSMSGLHQLVLQLTRSL